MSTIDNLQIEITQDSKQAVSGLDALTNTLGKLKSATRGGVGLTTVSNQIRKLNDAVKELQDPSAKISKLVSALKPLETIGKTNLNSTINTLKKLPDLTRELSAIDMDAFAHQIDRATSAIRPLATEMNKVAAGFSAFPSRIQRVITQNERLSASNSKASKSYGILGTGINKVQAKLGVLFVALKRIGNTMAGWVTESNSYVENLNLFRTSMRGAADEALDFAYKVNDVFGVDPSEWIRYQAVFQNMATGFGIAGDKAAVMSKNLTQLGYDLATIFNADYDKAMEKLQSAISGQPRPMREWGFDMSETTLKMVALNHGIKENVELMTQNEKAQLRYVQLMETASKQGILGNFAREIHTPANAFRILNQQILQFRRALGDMLIPLLMKILPYIQAFTKVLTNAARALAAFFGFQLPLIDYSGLDSFSTFAEDAEDSLDGATGAAKKLKNVLMGFDEINLLPDQDSGSGKGRVGIGGGDLGLDLEKWDYDFLGDTINKQVDELAERLQKPFENALKLAGLIGVAIASWKMSNALYSLFTGGGTNAFFKAIHNVNPVFLGMAITIGIVVARTIDLVKNSERFRQGLSAIWDGIKSGWNWLTNTAIPAIGEFFKNIIPPELAQTIASVFEPLRGVMKALDIDSVDWLLTLGSIALLFTPAAPFAAAILIFEGITLGIRALGYATSDAIEEIDILGDGISDITKQKMEPFLDQVRALDDTLTTIDWTGLAIDQTVVDDISTKVKTISKTIIDELDADKNEALKTLEPLKNALGEEAYNKLIADNTDYYDSLKDQVSKNEARIIEIYQTAANENRKVTKEEQVEINRIKDEQNKIGIRHLSETLDEEQLIRERMVANAKRVSLEQAETIMQAARETRESTISDAEMQYAKVELEAQRMLDVGAINKEQYNALMEAAAEARDETIKSAEEQYTAIEKTTKEKLGETARYMDWESLQMKSKWDIFCEDTALVWGILWDAVGKEWNKWTETIKTGWSSFTTSFKTGWFNFWYGIGNFFIGVWNGIVSGFESGVNWIVDGLNDLIDKYNSVASMLPDWIGDRITVSSIRRVSFGRVPLLNVPQFALGGFPSMGELFIAREAGPELVGSIGGRAAVANNDQIVAAVAQGVYEAMVMAMRMNANNSESSGEFVFNLDGRRFARAILPKMNEEAQRQGYSPILRYEGAGQ